MTLTLTSTLTPTVDVDGNVDFDPTVDLDPTFDLDLCEPSVQVNRGVNVYVAVKVNEADNVKVKG